MRRFLGVFLFTYLLVPVVSQANTYVKCGESVDLDTAEVTGYELELSSEGADKYSGPVGGGWNMKLTSESAAWLSFNKNVVAQSYNENGSVVVEIEIRQGQSIGGPVGTRYKLIGLFDDMPRLEKYVLGGFAAGTQAGVFQCLSGND